MSRNPPDHTTASRPYRKVPMSVTLFNPASLFQFMAEVLGPLRFGVYLIWPCVAFGAYAAIFNWTENQAHIERIFLTLGFFQHLLISILTANLFSKLMLGTTMAYHGVLPQVFGIRLLFGILPRFFVYKRPVRELPFGKQRSCYSAPLLTKLAMFGIGMLMWAVLRRSGTGAADLFLTLSITGLGAFLFTANPLWPADGYNWLSAWLKRPHLRKQSLRLTKMLLTGNGLPKGIRDREVAALLLYAVLSVGFSALIIFLALQTIALTLEDRLRGTGVIIFCIILALFTIFLTSLKSGKRR